MRQHLDMRIETAAIYCLFTVLSQKWNDLWNGVLLIAYKMSALNVPDADIIKMGGWEIDHIMKSVYRHSTIDKEENAKREASEKLRNAIFS